MDTKKFYESLRPEDRERVRLTVDELKAKGFEVYVAGSSLERADYNDIDIVAKPQEGMTESDARAGLDVVIRSLITKGASEPVDYKMLFTESAPDSHRYVQSNVVFRNRLNFVSDLNDLETHLDDKPRYVESLITDRREVIFDRKLDLTKDKLPYGILKEKGKSLFVGETKIDISVSYEPFRLNPETKHLQL